MTDLAQIEGIGPVNAEKLGNAGVSGIDGLLAAGGTADGRADLATKTGISAELLLEWVNHADLFRIDGVGSEYADLLEAAGVDSVPELAQRNTANLTEALAKANAEKNLVRALPAEAEVEHWIEHAKELDRVVHH
jgi:predicted flap endonuclease-1-like 5' DNA nuclease